MADSMSDYRIGRISAIAILVLSLDVGTALAQYGHDDRASWQRTEEGCEYWVSLQRSAATISSTIPCMNGKLEGEGLIRFFTGDDRDQYWEWDVRRARGVALVGGRLTPVIDESLVSAKSGSCSSPPAIRIVAPANLAYEFPEVKIDLFRLARKKWGESCKKTPISEKYQWYWHVEPDDSPDRNPWISRRPNPLDAVDSYSSHWSSESVRLRRARQDEQQAQIASNAAKARAARRAELAKKTGPFQVVSLADIAPNPFAWSGRVVGVCAMFEGMASPTTARFRGQNFSYTTVTGVPTSRFQRQTVVFLVGRVTGRNLTYIAAVDQPRDDGCSDFIDR